VADQPTENVSSRIRNSDGDRLAAFGSALRRLARASFYASSGINEFFRLRYEWSCEVIGCYVAQRGKRVTPFTALLSSRSETIRHDELARSYGELVARDICVKMISKSYGGRYYVCSRANNINSVAQLLCRVY